MQICSRVGWGRVQSSCALTPVSCFAQHGTCDACSKQANKQTITHCASVCVSVCVGCWCAKSPCESQVSYLAHVPNDPVSHGYDTLNALRPRAHAHAHRYCMHALMHTGTKIHAYALENIQHTETYTLRTLCCMHRHRDRHNKTRAVVVIIMNHYYSDYILSGFFAPICPIYLYPSSYSHPK